MAMTGLCHIPISPLLLQVGELLYTCIIVLVVEGGGGGGKGLAYIRLS